MATPEKQLLIRFNDVKITRLEAKFSGPDGSDEFNVNLAFDPIFYSEESKNKDFALSFKINVNSSDGAIVIDFDALAYFNTNEPITEDFKKSDWVNINAPAIAFPFLRSYVSTITLNSGVNPIILPAFNFTSLKNRERGSVAG